MNPFPGPPGYMPMYNPGFFPMAPNMGIPGRFPPFPMNMGAPMQHNPMVQAPPKNPPAAPVNTPPKPAVEQTTTVYVGKIPPTVEDEFIRKLLEFCGDVAFWRRVTDPTTGQLKGFAFCDFKSPEGVLRALRLLNGLEIDEHQLLLKVDDKNQKLLDAYIAKRNAEQHGITLKPGDTIAQTPTALGKEKEEDDTTRTKIQELVGRVHRVLAARRAGKDPAEEDLAEGDPTKDKAQLVSREIKSFRERQAQRDLLSKDRQLEEERYKHRDDDRDHREREFDSKKEIERIRLARDREREKESRRRRDDREKEREWEQTERIRERKRDDIKKRERRERDTRRREIEEQEYDSDEKARKRLRTRDARKRREKEREEDELDRIKEREEIEQKRRADEEKARADEQARIAQEAADAEKRRIDQQQQQRVLIQQQQQALQQQHKHAAVSPDGVASPTEESTTTSSLKLGFNKRNKIVPVAGFVVDNEDNEVVVKKKPLVMLDAPEHKDNQPGYSSTSASSLSASGNVKSASGKSGDRKVVEVQSVIDRIPTAKEDLFKIEVDWLLIEKHKIIERKMKPWVTKKIVEFLGEEEKTLIDFIMTKIAAHTFPEEILTQLTLVLDEEADIFVVKMWRMLVYEMYTASSK